MERMWYFAAEGKPSSEPIPEAELLARIRSGQIAPSTLVWTEGLAGWVPADSRPEFQTGPHVDPYLARPASARAPLANSETTLPTFGGWLSIVGIVNILAGALMVLTCIGLPVGVLMILAGSAALGAKAQLNHVAGGSPELASALRSLRTYFAMTGILLLLNVFVALLLLINLSGLAIAFSRLTGSIH